MHYQMQLVVMKHICSYEESHYNYFGPNEQTAGRASPVQLPQDSLFPFEL